MATPILVTGSHRSGTTWVGKMLSRPTGLAYVHEPFSPLRSPGWLGVRVPHWYLYVCSENEAPYLPAVRRMLDLRYPLGRDLGLRPRPRVLGQMALEWPRSVAARARGATPLLKDPIAVFSTEWLADRFGARPVVMIRHPAAFAGSLKRLDWRFDFRSWARQPLLLRDHLAPFQDPILDAAERPPGILDQAILMWNCIHHVIDGYRARRPEWAFVRYEDLAGDPLRGFRQLAEHLDLRWDGRMDREVIRFSSERNVKEVPAWQHRRVKRDSRAARTSWVRRLTAEERERIRAGTEAVAGRFYTEEDWAVEGASR
jgi:hypothetical protein